MSLESPSEIVEPPTSAEVVYQDRDMSWLEFNRRVLHEAQDERTPLLERLKFLAIFSSNLDEFFMKRIELLKRRAKTEQAGGEEPLLGIREQVLRMLQEQAETFAALVIKLREHGVSLAAWDELTAEQQNEARAYFLANILPVLTPLAVDPAHPFPFLSNLSTSLGVILRNPETGARGFARIKVPNVLPSWVALRTKAPGQADVFVRLHDILKHNLDAVFPAMEILDTTLFRVTRDAEVELNEDASTLRQQVAEELKQRRFEPVVRLEVQAQADPWLRELLVNQFELSKGDVYELSGELDYTGLMSVASLPRSDLRDPPWDPVEPLMLPDSESDIFAAIRAGDILVHHPYESFDSSVERFIRTAADDPLVRSIKMTVYRVGDDTPFVRSLVRAAESGKQVVCLIEVRARFDEARNLHWAAELERVGAHVVYGVIGLKTHTKTALVVRQEPNGVRCYAHIGTGNYHVRTARLYTDLGLFTCNPVLTGDLVDLFNFLSGYSLKRNYNKLLISPMTMRTRFLEMIEREIAHHQAGRPARVIAKRNQLEDPPICDALCAASRAGVPIDLVIRGFCCLRPGVPGHTENIRIISIIGRFLEHARIFHFASGAEDPLDGEFFIGSADWMQRNLSARVEAVAPVESRALKERLWEILELNLHDQRQAWDMRPDGTYVQRTPVPDATEEARNGAQATLMTRTLSRARPGRV
ncbi:MAG TPA: polyphosphate kinase 1 [Isosphaeraceae bacterium]|nr:polyphosphate kinase 1 [Isosphaeraceae bacterium]